MMFCSGFGHRICIISQVALFVCSDAADQGNELKRGCDGDDVLRDREQGQPVTDQQSLHKPGSSEVQVSSALCQMRVSVKKQVQVQLVNSIYVHLCCDLMQQLTSTVGVSYTRL